MLAATPVEAAAAGEEAEGLEADLLLGLLLCNRLGDLVGNVGGRPMSTFLPIFKNLLFSTLCKE